MKKPHARVTDLASRLRARGIYWSEQSKSRHIRRIELDRKLEISFEGTVSKAFIEASEMIRALVRYVK